MSQYDSQKLYRTRQVWREKPEIFYRDVLDMTLYDLQVEIARSVVKNRVTTVASCNSAGKTGTAGGLVPWYLLTHDESIVVTTAPTWRQVKDLLWREINTQYAKASARGIELGPQKPNVTSWQISSNWFAVGVSSKDPNRIQGYHADSGDILVIADEAAAIEELIFEGIHAILTSAGARFVMLGNPTSESGEFRDSFKPRSMAHQIRIDAFDTPNFKANNIRTEEDLVRIVEHSLRTGIALKQPYHSLISPIWAYERFKKWGPGSPLYQSRIRARFPEVGENNLIPLNWIEAATTNERLESVLGMNLPDSDDAQEKLNDIARTEALKVYIAAQDTIRGVDVARFGSDSTVITPRWDKVIGLQNVFHKLDTMQTAGRVWPLIRNLPTDYTGVDVIGVGGGVVDRLHELQHEQEAAGHGQFATVGGVDVASSPSDQPEGLPNMQYANKRAELYWKLREMFEAGDIYLMPDEHGQKPEDLMDELASIRYDFRGNKIYIEEKVQMKKRLQKSPDRADSLMLTLSRRAVGNGEGWHGAEDGVMSEIEDEEDDWEPGREDEGMPEDDMTSVGISTEY